MTLNNAQRDVLVRAVKTFVQAAVPAAVYAYQRGGPLAVNELEATLFSAAAAALAVLWNGGSALLGARRAAKLGDLARAIDQAVSAAQAKAVTPPAV